MVSSIHCTYTSNSSSTAENVSANADGTSLAVTGTSTAAFYKTTTSAINRQVINNPAKFEGDNFMFELNREEVESLSRCKNYISIQTKGTKGGRAYLPHAFT